MLATSCAASRFQCFAVSNREQIPMHRSLDREHIPMQWDWPPRLQAGWLVRKYGEKNFKM